jgi:hypothetical protein
MESRFYSLLRVLSLGLGGSWLLVCIWSWLVQYPYSQCGLLVRLAGLVTWGILPLVLPVILSLPISDKDKPLNWAAPMPLPVVIILLGWLGVLGSLIFDPPGACADGDILSAAGLAYVFLELAGAALLGLLTAGLQRLFRRG